MQINFWTLTQAVAGATLVAAVCCAPAAAVERYGHVHHRATHHPYYSSDVTVRKGAERAPVAAGPDAFNGPAALITAPIYIAGTFVSLPFRAFEVVFPPRANDPRVLIGAPVHFIGQVADFPFSTVNGAFGVRSTYSN
jgi:hypothetical protein